MDINIREASKTSDIQSIVYVIHEAFKQFENKLIPPSGAHKETIQSVEEKISEGGAFLAEYNSQIIGCALWKRNENDLYIGRLAVLPNYRELGIGNQILNVIEKKAVELGYDKILIGVRISMPNLIKYYQKLGYVIIEYCFHEGYQEPTYVKMIKKIEIR